MLHHRPFFILAENTVTPRGWWFAYQLPVSYYSIKNVFYGWPQELDFWVNLLRRSSYLSSSPLLSYKPLSFLLLEQTPYWCSFSFIDLLANILTLNHNIRLAFNSSNNVTLFSEYAFSIRFVRHPFFFDFTWEDWFTKVGHLYYEGDLRLGVSPTQIQRRIFFQYFWLGYWGYFLYDTPWPWRILYPKEKSNFRWLKYQFRSFFKSYIKYNRLFLIITLIFLVTEMYGSTLKKEIFWVSSFSELVFNSFYLWFHFIVFSFILYFPLARLAQMIYKPIKSCNNNILISLARLFSGESVLKRKKLIYYFTSIWHVLAFGLSIFWLYAGTPYWGFLVFVIMHFLAVPWYIFFGGLYCIILLLQWVIVPVSLWVLNFLVKLLLHVPLWKIAKLLPSVSLSGFIPYLDTGFFMFILLYYIMFFFAIYLIFIFWPFFWPWIQQLSSTAARLGDWLRFINGKLAGPLSSIYARINPKDL